MEIDLRDINRFIASERKRRHLTKKDLGEASGVSPNTICVYETKDQLPDYKCFLKLLNGLGYSTKVELKDLEDGEKVNTFSCDGCLYKNGSYCTHFAKAISNVVDCPYTQE